MDNRGFNVVEAESKDSVPRTLCSYGSQRNCTQNQECLTRPRTAFQKNVCSV